MNGYLNSIALVIDQLAGLYSREKIKDNDMWHLADMHLLANDIRSAIERDTAQANKISELKAENERLIPEFIDFIDGIQGRDLGGADVLSWSDINSAEDLRGFLHGFKALKEADK